MLSQSITIANKMGVTNIEYLKYKDNLINLMVISNPKQDKTPNIFTL